MAPASRCPQCPPVALTVADIAMSALVTFPLTILYWSTTWKFLDLHLLTPHPHAGPILSLLVGSVMIIFSYYALPLLRGIVISNDTDMDFTRHVFISVIFNYWTVAGNIFLWAGVWTITEQVVGVGLKASSIVTTVSLTCLSLLRATENAWAPPYILTVDYDPGFYSRMPRFRSKPQNWILHSLDIFVSVMVIQPLAVVLWASLWNTVVSLKIYPNQDIALYICMGIGYSSYILLFALQKPLRYIAGALHNRHRYIELVFANVFRVIVILSGLFFWLGCWGYMKTFVLTTKFVSKHSWFLIVGHCSSFSLLVLLQTASTLAGIGIAVDSEDPINGAGVDLSMNYFQHLCSCSTSANLASIQTYIDSDDSDGNSALSEAEPYIMAT